MAWQGELTLSYRNTIRNSYRMSIGGSALGPEAPAPSPPTPIRPRYSLRKGKGGHVTPILSPEESKEFLKRGFSRRNFGRIATMLTAGATLPFYNEPAMAQLSMVKGPM